MLSDNKNYFKKTLILSNYSVFNGLKDYIKQSSKIQPVYIDLFEYNRIVIMENILDELENFEIFEECYKVIEKTHPDISKARCVSYAQELTSSLEELTSFDTKKLCFLKTYPILEKITSYKNKYYKILDFIEKLLPADGIFEETNKWFKDKNLSNVNFLPVFFHEKKSSNIVSQEFNSTYDESKTICKIIKESFQDRKVSIFSPNDEIKKRILSFFLCKDIDTKNDFLCSIANFFKDPSLLFSVLYHSECNIDIKLIERLEKKARKRNDQAITKLLNFDDDFKLDIDFDKKTSFINYLNLHKSIFKKLSGADYFPKIIDLNIDNISIQEYAEIFLKLSSKKNNEKLCGDIEFVSIDDLYWRSFDVLMCCGLNEENLKPKSFEPWICDDEREVLGIETQSSKFLEKAFKRAIDSSNDIYLSRSIVEMGKTTIPSIVWIINANKILKEKISMFFKHNQKKIPLPCPKKFLRPKRYSVSDVDLLINNPYGFYAKKILNLYPINNLFEELKPSDFGTLIHELLKISLENEYFDDNPQKVLKNTAQILFKPLSDRTRLIWEIKFEKILYWLVNQKYSKKRLLEFPGKISLKIFDDLIEIKGIIDRIDIEDNLINVIDYKTGLPPSEKQIRYGIKPQLFLEGMISKEIVDSIFVNNTFNDLNCKTNNNFNYNIESLSIWSLKAPKPSVLMLKKGYKKNSDKDTENNYSLHQDLIEAKNGLVKLFEYYINDLNSYSILDCDFTDYSHLSRNIKN